MNALLPWPGWPRSQQVWVQETDPDVTDDELALLIDLAATSVTGKHTRHRDGTESRVEPVGDHALRAAVHCIGQACGGRAGLAYVWRTEAGPLYWARLVYSHDHNPVAPGVLLTHPTLPAGQVIEVAESAVEHHRTRGWVTAPPGTRRPARTYRQPMYGIDVRDLLDVDSPGHPPLRAKCPLHGEVTLDRDRLRAELARGRDTPGVYRIPLSAVVG